MVKKMLYFGLIIYYVIVCIYLIRRNKEMREIEREIEREERRNSEAENDKMYQKWYLHGEANPLMLFFFSPYITDKNNSETYLSIPIFHLKKRERN